MDVQEQNKQRYRARAARRPVLYWWQAFLVLGTVVFLWSQLPLTAVLYEARTVPPLPEAHAAYVELDPAFAAQAFKKSLSAWTLGVGGGKLVPGLDLGGIDMENTLQPPEYLEHGAYFPGVWQPASVLPLAQRVPEVRVPSVADGQVPSRLSEREAGVHVVLSSALQSIKLSFPFKQELPPERSGQCRFYVETGKDGTVEHVLLLTAGSPGAAFFERALLRGRANGAGCGFVDLYWMFTKS
jgi:hypothetical protein